MKIKIGDKLKLKEKNKWLVRYADKRYLICTKPYNLKKTYFYTIIDLQEKIRGSHNIIFNCYDFEDYKECRLAVMQIYSGDLEISHRNRIDLEDDMIIIPKNNI